MDIHELVINGWIMFKVYKSSTVFNYVLKWGCVPIQLGIVEQHCQACQSLAFPHLLVIYLQYIKYPTGSLSYTFNWSHLFTIKMSENEYGSRLLSNIDVVKHVGLLYAACRNRHVMDEGDYESEQWEGHFPNRCFII